MRESEGECLHLAKYGVLFLGTPVRFFFTNTVFVTDSQLNVEDITGCGVEEHIRLYAKYDSVKSGKVTMTLENLLERKENDKIINSASLGSQVSSK